MAGLARLGHALDRLVHGVCVVTRALVQGDRQDDTDQAGPGRAHVQAAGGPEAGPDRLGVDVQDRTVVVLGELLQGRPGCHGGVASGVELGSDLEAVGGLRVVADVRVVEA